MFLMNNFLPMMIIIRIIIMMIISFNQIESQYYLETFAGNGASQSSGDGGPATSASINGPAGLWGDTAGTLYIGEYGANKIRKVMNGVISTFIGAGPQGFLGIGGSPLSVSLDGAYGVYGDSQSHVLYCSGYIDFIWSYNYSTVKVSRYAGRVPAGVGYAGDTQPATTAALSSPRGIFLDSTGVLYFADEGNCRIRYITVNGIINTFAGNGTAMYGGDNHPATKAAINLPNGVWGNSIGVIFIADTENQRVRKVIGGIITTFAGNGTAGYHGDNIQATSTTINSPSDVKGDTIGNIYISETNGCRIRLVAISGIISTFIGTGICTSASTAFQLASTATIAYPYGLWLDTENNLYFAENLANFIRKVVYQTPSPQPTSLPSSQPVGRPSSQPTTNPSERPSTRPSSQPTSQPIQRPTARPSGQPSRHPSNRPSVNPTSKPTTQPSSRPSRRPSGQPSGQPSIRPSFNPTSNPTMQPSSVPSETPSGQPTSHPSSRPSRKSCRPSFTPIMEPTRSPTMQPTSAPSMKPSGQPSDRPSNNPTSNPTIQPSSMPSSMPSRNPSVQPSSRPSFDPTMIPTIIPSSRPSRKPSEQPSNLPSISPTTTPTIQPSSEPSRKPSVQPSETPSKQPTIKPTLAPSAKPFTQPSCLPSTLPTSIPSQRPFEQPSRRPSISPTVIPTILPSGIPSSTPSSDPSEQPSVSPTTIPTNYPTILPSSKPSRNSCRSTILPSSKITNQPLIHPTILPTRQPTSSKMPMKSIQPSVRPSVKSTSQPNSLLPTTLNPSLSTSTPSFVSTAVFMTTNSNLTIWKEILCLIGVFTVASTFSSNFNSLNVLDPKEGLAFILFGRKSLPKDVFINATLSSRSYLLAKEAVSYQRDTVSRTASIPGDLNQDGWNDLLLCTPITSICYIFFGTESGITSALIGTSIIGTTATDFFGFSVSLAGNMNADKIPDVIICALSKKICYVLYGKLSWGRTMEISEITGADGYQIMEESSTLLLGLSVTGLGDVNGDSYDDVAISAMTSISSSNYVIYVIYGSGKGETVLLSAIENGVGGFRITGEAGYYTGLSISGIGDVNEDGFTDLAIGKVPYPGSQKAQSTVIIFGSSVGEDILLSNNRSSEREGRVLEVEGGGFIVSGIGDVNHDGIADVLLIASDDYVGKGNAYIVTYPRDVTSSPSLRPSSSPSSSPSTIPSSKPITSFPTHFPSRRSSNPSESSSAPSFSISPSNVNSTLIPSKAPTHLPSRRSNKPTIPPTIVNTRLPTATLFPSKKPSVLPSIPPSYLVTKTPTQRPSYRPSCHSTAVSSPQPSPTSTLISNETITITTGGHYIATSGEWEVFEVKGSGAIEIDGGVEGNIYVIFPPSSAANKTVLTISNFLIQRDLIDLRHFLTIHSVNDISFSDNPLTLYLTKNVKMICSSLRSIKPNSIQFLFASSESNEATTTTTTLLTQTMLNPLTLFAVVVMVICVCFVMVGWCSQDSSMTMVEMMIEKNIEKRPDSEINPPEILVVPILVPDAEINPPAIVVVPILVPLIELSTHGSVSSSAENSTASDSSTNESFHNLQNDSNSQQRYSEHNNSDSVISDGDYDERSDLSFQSV